MKRIPNERSTKDFNKETVRMLLIKLKQKQYVDWR